MDVDISQAAGTHEDSRALPGRWKHAPGTRSADGGSGGHAGVGGLTARPQFNAPVGTNGYRWWYIDATSDDGRHGICIIGFVGSVFSPYYSRARKQGRGDPENHCAINVALYGSPRRWAMTERGIGQVKRQNARFSVGASAMTWGDDGLHIDVHERCSPLPFPLRGHISLKTDQTFDMPVSLDAEGKHWWQVIAPCARIHVEMERPRLSWSGSAYHDMNWGAEPLEHGFSHWSWLRTHNSRGTHVVYDLQRRDESQFRLGRSFSGGLVSDRTVPKTHDLKSGLWGMKRSVPSENTPKLLAALEDAPFYTRNHVAITLDGEPCEAYHESLSLDRFMHPLTQLMLPFRMPRFS